MNNSTQAVNAVVDAIVIAMRELNYLNVVEHCVVSDVLNTPVVYVRDDKGLIHNVYMLGDQAMVVDTEASPEFAAKLEPLWLPMETRQERIRSKRIIQNEAIFIAVAMANGFVEDSHAGNSFTQLSHIARFGEKGGRETVIAIYTDNRFSVNELGLSEDGKVFLSTCSVGGTMDTVSMSVEEAVAGYKDFSGNVIWDLTRVDGLGLDQDEPVVEANPWPTPDRLNWSPIKLSRHLRNHKIIEAVKAAGGNIRDTHRFEAMIQVTHVALFGVPGYKEQVVCLLDGKLFCINPIELDHDEPFLSVNSVGGNLNFADHSMEQRLKTYHDYDHNILWELTRVDGK
jgi:hypothetical protein